MCGGNSPLAVLIHGIYLVWSERPSVESHDCINTHFGVFLC